MRKYKHIIFDIDGTLIDTEEAILQSLQDTVREILHKDIEKPELRFALGIPGSVALRTLGITDTERANDRWNEHLLKYKSRIRHKCRGCYLHRRHHLRQPVCGKCRGEFRICRMGKCGTSGRIDGLHLQKACGCTAFAWEITAAFQ